MERVGRAVDCFAMMSARPRRSSLWPEVRPVHEEHHHIGILFDGASYESDSCGFFVTFPEPRFSWLSATTGTSSSGRNVFSTRKSRRHLLLSAFHGLAGGVTAGSRSTVSKIVRLRRRHFARISIRLMFGLSSEQRRVLQERPADCWRCFQRSRRDYRRRGAWRPAEYSLRRHEMRCASSVFAHFKLKMTVVMPWCSDATRAHGRSARHDVINQRALCYIVVTKSGRHAA